MKPDWWEPLLGRIAASRRSDFSRLPVPPDGGRPSAVLILLAESDGVGPDVLLLERAADMRHHAGQPAFPGGAADPGDVDPPATALREAAEEVGLDASTVEVQAQLPELWIPVSRFVVTPVLAWWREPHAVAPMQSGEVARVERVPVAELVDPANRVWVRHPSGWIGPAFRVRSMLVWGFTAGVLSVLLDLAGWAVPWDDAPQLDFPIAGDRPVP
ncbi:MAG: coenzyme A pyrophosphatase [Actinobacteria bacterium 13_1_20CM_3_71_11]|nr:MAG: coenzyme A pyrophosphatase [Actinobacteria bacterium 13_1_20CM_3_71_11]